MALPDIKVEEELIDESADATNTTTDKSNADAPPDGGSGGRRYSAGQPAGDGPESAGGTSRALGKSFADIAAGNSRGEYPALDAIIGRPRSPRHAEDPAGYAETVCTPDCPNRRRDPEYDESPYAAPPPVHLISDVKPSTRERMYHLEKEVQRHDRDFETIRQISLNGATVGAVQAVNERVDHVHIRIDRDILPELNSLRRRRVFKDIIVVTSLIVSLVGNIIGYYIMFVKNP